MAGTVESVKLPAFPKHRTQLAAGVICNVEYEHRATRTVPALVHMYKHARGGLENVIPYNLQPEHVALPGRGHIGAPQLAPSIKAAMLAGQGISSYSWEHGGSEIPSPAEFMYTAGQIGVRLVQTTKTPPTYDMIGTHVISPTDVKGDVDVLFIAQTPSAYVIGDPTGENTNAVRARSRAVAVLKAAHNCF